MMKEIYGAVELGTGNRVVGQHLVLRKSGLVGDRLTQGDDFGDFIAYTEEGVDGRVIKVVEVSHDTLYKVEDPTVSDDYFNDALVLGYGSPEVEYLDDEVLDEFIDYVEDGFYIEGFEDEDDFGYEDGWDYPEYGYTMSDGDEELVLDAYDIELMEMIASMNSDLLRLKEQLEGLMPDLKKPDTGREDSNQ